MNPRARHRNVLASLLVLASALLITTAVLWRAWSRNAPPPQPAARVEERAPIELTIGESRVWTANGVKRPIPKAFAPYYERFGFGKPVLCCLTH
jgi:hypothetical protein